MSEYLEAFKQLRGDAVKINEQLGKELNIQSDQIPISVFNMIHNDLVIGIELFSSYMKLWKNAKIKPGISDERIEQIKDENGQRIKQVQKIIFVSSMSSFEYVAKEYHKIHPTKLGGITRRNGRIYLRNILEKSAEIDLIEEEQHKLWNGLLNFRNMIVHNNAISDITETYEYSNCTLVLVEEEMTQGNLLLFPNLLDWMIDAIRDWIFNINQYKPSA
ncbi:MAG: hypothetical protein E4H21_01115 [Thermodesulfobacteriales bacterium]|nr:MAG: hypothetical protein E4H21_01115 [Thermodesulfobacteriales bacterium]